MNKAIKIRILRRALKMHRYNYKEFSGDIWELPTLVEDDPTEFIETCVEEAYQEGLKHGGKK